MDDTKFLGDPRVKIVENDIETSNNGLNNIVIATLYIGEDKNIPHIW